MINEVVLSPRLDENQEQSFSMIDDCSEQKRINFLQQLIATQGPNDGTSIITVMPLNCHLNSKDYPLSN